MEPVGGLYAGPAALRTRKRPVAIQLGRDLFARIVAGPARLCERGCALDGAWRKQNVANSRWTRESLLTTPSPRPSALPQRKYSAVALAECRAAAANMTG